MILTIISIQTAWEEQQHQIPSRPSNNWHHIRPQLQGQCQDQYQDHYQDQFQDKDLDLDTGHKAITVQITRVLH